MNAYTEKKDNLIQVKKLSSIGDLVVGEIYSNTDIAKVFKCSNMGGMRRSKATNSLVLIAKHTNPLYDDHWTEDGILNYTGMGTIGDQSITIAQNQTLAAAKQNGINVYLFESYKQNEYYYYGEVEVCGSITTAQESDINGMLRTVIKFPLRQKSNFKKVIIDEEDINESLKCKQQEVKKLSFNELKLAATKLPNKTYSKEITTTYRDRNQIVSQYTKLRSKGICDLCGKEAPFKSKNGEPYLESHHVITLADGGPDVTYNTVALCPNCHRKMHALKDKNDIKKLTNMLYNYLLTENEKEQLEEFNKLFNDK